MSASRISPQDQIGEALAALSGDSTSEEVEDVARKKVSESALGNESGDSACPCGGTLIVPQISKAKLTASLCECAPKRREKPSLADGVSQRFFLWERQNAESFAQIDSRSDARRPPRMRAQMPAPVEFSGNEVAAFQAHLREKQESEAHNAHVVKVCQDAERKIEAINAASFPCRMLPPRRSELPRAVQLWLKSLGSQTPESLFLHGTPGTGKTTLAVWAAYYALVDGHIADACFLTSDLIMSFRKDANVSGFNSRDNDSCRQKWTGLKSYLERASLIIIDDIGSQKNSESVEAAYSEVIGLRYTSGLPAIFTSNHSAKDGLDRRTLADQIGPRAADRVLGSRTYAMTGPSKRGVEPEDETLEQECEVVDMELVRNFRTTGIEEGETTSPFFVAHNPVFQLVSDKERASHTNDKGEDITLPLRTYRDTWHVGDRLDVAGFLLCQNDLLCFLCLLELLHDYHRDGGRGLSFETTISAVRKKLGLKNDGSNTTKRLIRSIDRLAMTKIRYIGHNRERFIGGFIDTVRHKSATSQSKLMISLNPAFINFYERLSFFKLNGKIPPSLSYQARLLYVFLESIPEDAKTFPLSQLAKLYGKNESSAKNRNFRESVRDSLAELKSCGLQGPDAQLGANGMIATQRLSRSPQALSLPC